MTDIMKKTLGILMTTGMLLSLCGCDLADPINNNNNGTGKERVEVCNLVLTAAEDSVSDASNDFAFRFMKAFDSTNPDNGNYVVSPYSAQVALAMALNGAAGSTFNQMRDVLGYGGMDIENINSYNKKLIEGLGNVASDVDIDFANSLWLNDWYSYSILDQYRYNLVDSYFAEVGALDFSSDDAVKHINRWCSSKTNSLIDNMVDELDPVFDLAVLLNALYFKACWATEFEKKNNFKGNFLANGNSKQKVQYMKCKKRTGYHKNDKYEVSYLDFSGSGMFRFYVLLPADGVTTDECFDEFAAMSRSGFAIGSCLVTFSIPKFSVKKNCDLEPALVSMGMSEPFGEYADFSNIVSERFAETLHITDVAQGNVFKINEKGVEASSVTKVELGLISSTGIAPKEVDFVVNRPFLFIVTERHTNTVLYAGKVSRIE